jgi:hypothetical protein
LWAAVQDTISFAATSFVNDTTFFFCSIGEDWHNSHLNTPCSMNTTVSWYLRVSGGMLFLVYQERLVVTWWCELGLLVNIQGLVMWWCMLHVCYEPVTQLDINVQLLTKSYPYIGVSWIYNMLPLYFAAFGL